MGGPEAGQHTMDKGPLFVVFGHGGFAVFFERVIFAFAACLALAPAGFDEAAVFEAVEDGVEHAVGPLEFAAGAGFDFLDDGVAVAFAVGQEGENQRLGGGGDGRAGGAGGGFAGRGAGAVVVWVGKEGRVFFF